MSKQTLNLFQNILIDKAREHDGGEVLQIVQPQNEDVWEYYIVNGGTQLILQFCAT